MIEFKNIGKHRRRNYDICTSIDMIHLRCTLDEMMKDGSITLGEAEAFTMQARGLLDIITTRNDQHFNK